MGRKFSFIKELREHRKDLCDFFENEDIITEDQDEFQLRLEKIKSKIGELPKGKKVLIVTHSDVIFSLTLVSPDYGELVPFKLLVN